MGELIGEAVIAIMAYGTIGVIVYAFIKAFKKH